MINSFDTHSLLDVGDLTYHIHRLNRIPGVERLPYSVKILLENLLRCEDGEQVTAAQIEAVTSWDPTVKPHTEIEFTPARVLLQDFTGVPCVVDLVAMRDAMAVTAGQVDSINPQVPVDLVIDHSVIADAFGSSRAFQRNAELEFHRNKERYALLKWAQESFDNFRVVPPDTGICHQVNLEYLAPVVFTSPRADHPFAYPDTLVGTDSHTPMVNGLGVLAWGVGGIEAEAAMLGQPVSMLIPDVLGLKLTGKMKPGCTATDLVLTVTELLRRTGVVGSFVEFFGPGVASVPLADRATLGNMTPEYGSTCSIFPIDQVTIDYLRLTGRPDDKIALVETYAKEQGLWHDPGRVAAYSRTVELNLDSVEPSLAGPKRPQDRIPLSRARLVVARHLCEETDSDALSGLDEADWESFPASDPMAISRPKTRPQTPPRTAHQTGAPTPPWPSNPAQLTFDDGTQAEVDHGAVVIASITSCTNTSNPAVMIAAGLLAKRAVERGLQRKPWVKTSLAPGSRVVTDYLNEAGLTPYLNDLGFDLVGYGCTTCIGNSGPLIPEVSEAIKTNDLSVCAVLSGNRNFEGRIHPETALNFLASPPLVVAYALTGTLNIDLLADSLGTDEDGNDVMLADLWPNPADIEEVIASDVRASMFRDAYAHIYDGDERWRSMEVAEGEVFSWDEESSYVRHPPFCDDLPETPDALHDITGARVLALLGDSVTTDHISPAGSIAHNSPAGKYLQSLGVEPADFNSYGSRRGNHEVMLRGTLANVRIRNRLVEGTQGGYTRVLLNGSSEDPISIFDAAMAYQDQDVPLLIIAGTEYGSGSSRDWAAKGTRLLGVKAVLAKSYERIHRSNLIGMGVLPLQFGDGHSAESLGLTGLETYAITDLEGAGEVPAAVQVEATGSGDPIRFTADVRIDTPVERAYFLHRGILPYMLRQLRQPQPA